MPSSKTAFILYVSCVLLVTSTKATKPASAEVMPRGETAVMDRGESSVSEASTFSQANPKPIHSKPEPNSNANTNAHHDDFHQDDFDDFFECPDDPMEDDCAGEESFGDQQELWIWLQSMDVRVADLARMFVDLSSKSMKQVHEGLETLSDKIHVKLNGEKESVKRALDDVRESISMLASKASSTTKRALDTVDVEKVHDWMETFRKESLDMFSSLSEKTTDNMERLYNFLTLSDDLHDLEVENARLTEQVQSITASYRFAIIIAIFEAGIIILLLSRFMIDGEKKVSPPPPPANERKSSKGAVQDVPPEEMFSSVKIQGKVFVPQVPKALAKLGEEREDVVSDEEEKEDVVANEDEEGLHNQPQL